MKVRWPKLGVVVLAICWSLGNLGCRENYQPRAHNRALGTDARPLLPVAPVAHDARLATGRADWVEFREPTQEQEALGPEAQIRAMIKEFNELVEDEEYDSLPDYFVEEQQETVASLIEAFVTMMQISRQLTDAIEGQDADGVDEAVANLWKLGDPSELLIEVGAITFNGDTKAVGITPASDAAARVFPDYKDELHFLLVDDDWYIKDPNMAAVAPIVLASVNILDTMLSGVLQAVQSGQVPVETLVAQINTVLGGQPAEEAEPAPGADGEDEDPGAEPEPEEEKPPPSPWG